MPQHKEKDETTLLEGFVSTRCGNTTFYTPPIRTSSPRELAEVQDALTLSAHEIYLSEDINFSPLNGWILVERLHQNSEERSHLMESTVLACEARKDQKLRAGFTVLCLASDAEPFHHWDELYHVIHESRVMGYIPSFTKSAVIRGGNPFGSPF